MVTDQQVRRLFKLMQTEATGYIAAAKAGMDEKTARKYLNAGKLPSELLIEHTWRTRGVALGSGLDNLITGGILLPWREKHAYTFLGQFTM